MSVFPQVLTNVKVGSKPAIESIPQINEAIRSAEAELGDRGRVLVRYSGTQPLCRVMVEGLEKVETQRICNQIVEIIKENLATT